MFEPTFCYGLGSPTACIWAWKFVVWVGLGLVFWVIVKPKKDPKRITNEK